MATHTSGPWKWEEGEDNDMPKLTSPAGCVCDFGNDTMYYPNSGNPPSEADSWLIAAAPDLLAALQGVIRVADRNTVEFDAARAAIARALGDV